MRKRKGSWCPHLLALSVVDERLYLHCLEESHAQKQQPCRMWGEVSASVLAKHLSLRCVFRVLPYARCLAEQRVGRHSGRARRTSL